MNFTRIPATPQIELFKAAVSSIPQLEAESSKKDSIITDLKDQLNGVSNDRDTLNNQIHSLQLELAKSTAVVETQQMMLGKIDEHFGKNKEEMLTKRI